VLVLVDHEGGRVVRFHEGVTRFPDALTVGRTQGIAGVERQGAVEAEELRRLGVHVNLAPCVDVLEPGADPVIGDRSYGSDAEQVSALAVARIRGLQARGVAACAKHFPGLGAVPQDPHRVLPTIRLSWSEMERHLRPFRAAIEGGVAMVMSSHVCYPLLGDPEGVPATYWSRLIRETLRVRLRFAGVIVTVDMALGAVGAVGSLGEGVIRASEAGHDLLVICFGPDQALEAAAALRRAYEAGRLRQADLERSVERLARLRRGFLGEPLSGSRRIW
jgi:beta-N-acetylhexosaminidase